MRRLRSLLPALFTWLAAACGAGGLDPDDRVRLVALVVVDQLRPDLIERYDDLYTGGMRRLLDEGHVFPEATHAHAATETAPGHATLATGAHPARHGIVGNSWYEERGGEWVSVYSVEDTLAAILGDPTAPGRSYRNLLSDGLADWVRAADPEARVVSISRKDRAAATMGGRGGSQVYWVSAALPGLTTSTAYRDSLPGWIQALNAGPVGQLAARREWLNESPPRAWARSRPDTASYEGNGRETAFPHAGSSASWALTSSPYGDEAVALAAVAALRELELGRRDGTDFLAVSFSQTDAVGHAYGPTSREQLDNLLRLDRLLGELFTALDEQVGEDRWVVGFSADHGVLTEPEYAAQLGEPGRRVPREDRAALSDARQAALSAVGADATPTERALRLAAAVTEVPGIAAAYAMADLLAKGESADTFLPLYRRSFRADRRNLFSRDPAVAIRRAEGEYTGARGTGHGSPYHYDRWVPFILLGGGVPAGTGNAAVRTVDMAPTLAALAGIPLPGELDGRVVLPAARR